MSTGIVRLVWSLWLIFATSICGAAGPRVNQPGAFLIHPVVLSEGSPEPDVETFVGVTNLAEQAIVAHVAFFVGADASCAPCELDVPLGPRGSETLVFSRGVVALNGDLTVITGLASGASTLCPAGDGFVTIHAESESGETLYDDVLIGDAVVADYTSQTTSSLSALPFQTGGVEGDGSRRFDFDGQLLARFPDELNGGLQVPDSPLVFGDGGVRTELVLFNAGFDASGVDCEIELSGANDSVVSASRDFFCWDRFELSALDSGMAFPFLATDTGSVRIACSRTDGSAGGVHGAILQFAADGSVLRRGQAGPAMQGAGAWARLLGNGTTAGDPVALDLDDNCPGIPDPDQTDTDGDGLGDACDDDDDGDSVADGEDSQPLNPNACRDLDGDTCDDCTSGSANTAGDGLDGDGDGFCDAGDNCPLFPNPDQADADGDGIGDACLLTDFPIGPKPTKKPQGKQPDRLRDGPQ